MLFKSSRSRLLISVGFFASFISTSAIAQDSNQSTAVEPVPASQVNEARVRALLAQMTLQEKLQLIRGAPEPSETYQGQAGYVPGVPRLGIPPLRLADGPPGVLTREISAAPPATMALAATFDTGLMEEVGAVIGRNARARGIDVVLEPYINLHRDQVFRRAYNTLGEDPLLTGMIGAALVRGIQQQGVMAQAKHLAAYEGANDVKVGDQALHEIYLAPFKDVIDAGVSSLMCSYNKVGGVYACGNEQLLKGELKNRLGFTGFVTSDWGAVHGTEYIARGLDLEMPGLTDGPMAAFLPSYLVETPPPPLPGGMAVVPPFFGSGEMPEEVEQGPPAGMPQMEGLAPGSTNTLGEAFRRGSLNMGDIDAAAARVLGQMERFGYLDHQPSHVVVPEAIERNAAILERASAKAAVLLKNDGALPLSKSDLQRTVFVGPGAVQTFAVVASGEKALGWPSRQIGVTRVLEHRTGRPVAFAVATDMNGKPVPPSAFSDLNLTIDGKLEHADEIDATLSAGSALRAVKEARWEGVLVPPSQGDYDLNLQIIGGSASLLVDGKEIATTGSLALHGDVLQAGEHNVIPTPDGLDNIRRRVSLTENRHQLRIDAKADTSGQPLQVRLSWVTPGQRADDRAAAIAAASKADKAVVFAWSRGKPDPFRLAGDQDELVSAIAAVNPNTIVVLNTSQPVAMPWLPRVKAVLQMWYTGDEGGAALADILTGQVSPSGRLPFTWPAKLTDGPANDPTRPEWTSSGKDGATTYGEGIMVGYRWFDSRNITPLFPFGHGLSYSGFSYSDLNITRNAARTVTVSFSVKNDGKMTSDEVPQVYLGRPKNPPTGADFAERSLIGFTRVTLKPGETRTVSVSIPAEKFAYWSTSEAGWRVPSSERPIWVGASSRDLRLMGRLDGKQDE